MNENDVVIGCVSYVANKMLAGCAGCAFDSDTIEDARKCIMVKCLPHQRSDKKNVIFVEKQP
jgi:hypothetical protein